MLPQYFNRHIVEIAGSYSNMEKPWCHTVVV